MLTDKEYKNRIKKINSNVIVLGKYTGMHNKLQFKCKVCGNEWEAKAYHVSNGEGCKICGLEKVRKALTMSNEEFKNRLKKEQPTIIPLEKYQKNHKKIKVKCAICGNIWETSPHTILGKKKSGCPQCSLKKISEKFSKNHQQYVDELKRVNKDIVVLGKYINSKTKIKFECKRCGNVWVSQPSTVLKSGNCPQCTKSGTSYVEQVILLTLRKVLGTKNVLSRDKSIINKELDVYIPKYKIAIEYGSWFWHKKRVDTDNSKQQLCKKYGIDLLSIFDTEKKNVKDSKNTWHYKQYVGKNIEDLYSLMSRILNYIGKPYDNRKVKAIVDSINNEAINKSLKMGTEEFLKIIASNYKTIEILSPFKGRNNKVLCKCKICETEWETTPGRLLTGRGCKKCGYITVSNKLTMSNDEFLRKFKEKNSQAKTIIILDNYVNSKEKLRCKCIKCNNIWKTTPNSLLDNHGCPNCANIVEKEIFINKFRKENSNYNDIEILSEYKGICKKIKCKCKRCKEIWYPTAKSLLENHGCPKCAKQRLGQEEFIDRFKKRNSKYNEIELLNDYHSMRTKIKCRCKKCNHMWQTTPSVVRQIKQGRKNQIIKW